MLKFGVPLWFAICGRPTIYNERTGRDLTTCRSVINHFSPILM
jgi:hypothetical protein